MDAHPQVVGERRRAAARALLAGLLTVVVLLVGAAPAAAHTSLAESDPPSRAVLDEAPTQVRLVFANAVDPTTVSATLKRLDGSVVDGVVRATPAGADTYVVVFALPPVDDGTYGLAWQAIGPDGHRVAGEVVFGVDASGTGSVAADVASASFDPVTSGDRALDAAGILARGVWYVGLSLAVGALALLWWLLGDPRAGAIRLRRAVRWWGSVGAGLALVGAASRWMIAALVLRRAGIGSGSAAGRTVDALREASGLAWLVAIAALLVALVALDRLGAEQARGVRAVHAARVAAGAIVVGAVCSVLSGHAAAYPAPVLSELAAGAHLLAAAVWVGPLAVLLLAQADAGWLALERVERGPVLAALLRRFSPAAVGAFAVLVATGVRTVSVTTGTRLLDSSWGWVVLGKASLVVAVAVPLGAHHHRRVRQAAQAASPLETASLADAGVGRSLRLESAVLLLALGLGSTLLSLSPSFALSADELEALRTDDAVLDQDVLGGGPVDDVATCQAREIGKPDCYRAYFAGIMRAEGADAAVAEVYDLSLTDDFVQIDCHQITHDLGEDAVHFYGGVGEAFSFEGSACWSGYYHGIIETALSDLDDEEMAAALPTVCDDTADPRYTFAHYNCVHGTGHGVMLRTGDDLWRSLDLCRELLDPWEQTSCWGGAFMENVIGAQAGRPAVFSADDLLFPCTGVAEDTVEQCLLMQTSYVLWQNGYDYEAGFELCETLEGWKAQTCYQSMGRDISGNFLLDVDEVIAHCDLGDESLREFCYAGAVLNAVFNDHGTDSADALCAAVEERWRPFCEENRDGAAATL